jgi:diguanylate cyclase (GGDEF)-like protein
MKLLPNKVLLQALDCGVGGAVIVDSIKPGCPVVYVSPLFEELTGYDASELINRPLADLVDKGDVPRFPFDQSERVNQRWTVKNGLALELAFKVSPLYNRPGQAAYLLLSDCSRPDQISGDGMPDDKLRIALDDARVRLKRLERTDSVTGLVNRKTFLEIFQRDWGLSRRAKRSVAVIIFAIDDFTGYRELFGRHAADSCLRKVAHTVNGSLRRDSDVVAHYDNDKFVALIGNADESQAIELAARIAGKVRKLSIHHPRSRADRFITLSFGVASEVPEWTAHCSMLLDAAEVRLEEFCTGLPDGGVQGRAG